MAADTKFTESDEMLAEYLTTIVASVKTSGDAGQLVANNLESKSKLGGGGAMIYYTMFAGDGDLDLAEAATTAMLKYYSAKNKQTWEPIDSKTRDQEINRILGTITKDSTQSEVMKFALDALTTTPRISMCPLLEVHKNAIKMNLKHIYVGIGLAFHKYHEQINKKA